MCVLLYIFIAVCKLGTSNVKIKRPFEMQGQVAKVTGFICMLLGTEPPKKNGGDILEKSCNLPLDPSVVMVVRGVALSILQQDVGKHFNSIKE